MDINRPVENPALLDAMNQLRQGKGSEEVFFSELFQAKFLCPAQVERKGAVRGKRGKASVEEGSTVFPASIRDQEGNHFLMAFTDWQELRKWSEEKNLETLVLTYEDYQYMVVNDGSPYAGAVINPYGANIVLNRDMLQNIHPDKVTMQAGEEVMIGVPKDYPVKMAEALKREFAKRKDVKCAYLLWMARGDETSYLLILDADGNEQKLFPVIGEMCQPYLDGEFMDMVPLYSQFGQSAAENQEPFYRRG